MVLFHIYLAVKKITRKVQYENEMPANQIDFRL